MTRVLGRIGEHWGGQRALGPVCFLVLLGEFHAGVLGEQGREADGRLARELGGDARVEQPRGAESVVAVQDPEVVVGVVKGLLDAPVGEHRAEGGEIGDGEGIDQRRAVRGRDLDEVDPVAVAVKAGRLRIHGDAGNTPHCGDQLGEALRLRDVTIHAGSAYSGLASRSMPAAISSSALAKVL